MVEGSGECPYGASEFRMLVGNVAEDCVFEAVRLGTQAGSIRSLCLLAQASEQKLGCLACSIQLFVAQGSDDQLIDGREMLQEFPRVFAVTRVVLDQDIEFETGVSAQAGEGFAHFCSLSLGDTVPIQRTTLRQDVVW